MILIACLRLPISPSTLWVAVLVKSSVLTYTLCGNPPQPVRCLPSNQPVEREPHVATRIRRGLSQRRLAWSTTMASYTNAIPQAYGNVSSFTKLQFRAAINFTSPYNVVSRSQDLSVLLTDASGRSARAQISAYSRALFYPRGSGTSILITKARPVPKVVLNTVSIPLSVFKEARC